MKTRYLLLLGLLAACDGAPIHEPSAPQDRQLSVNAAPCVDNPDYRVGNRAQLIDALNAAPAGSVIGIDGMIELRNALFVETAGLTFTCASAGSGLRVESGFTPIYLMFVNAADVAVRGLVLDARGTSRAPLQVLNNGVSATATHMTLEQNHVWCGPEMCAFFIGTTGSVVRANTFMATGGITGVHLQGGGALTPRFAIGLDGTRVEDNTIITAASSIDSRFAALRVRDGDGVYIGRNTIRGPWLNGIATAELANSRFEHNDIAGATQYGIRMATNAIAYPSMRSNTFLANRFGATGQAAFWVNDACGNAYVGNIVTKKDANYAAIFEASSGANVFVGAGGHDAVDNGVADCDADGSIDGNRLSGQGKVLRGVAVGSIMQSSKNAGDLN